MSIVVNVHGGHDYAVFVDGAPGHGARYVRWLKITPRESINEVTLFFDSVEEMQKFANSVQDALLTYMRRGE